MQYTVFQVIGSIVWDPVLEIILFQKVIYSWGQFRTVTEV